MSLSKETKIILIAAGTAFAGTAAGSAIIGCGNNDEKNLHPTGIVSSTPSATLESPLRPITPTEISQTYKTPVPTETPVSVESRLSKGYFGVSPDSRVKEDKIDPSKPLEVIKRVGRIGDYVKVTVQEKDGRLGSGYIPSQFVEDAEKLPELTIDQVDWVVENDLTKDGPLSYENPGSGWSQKTIANNVELPSSPFRFAFHMAMSGQQGGVAFFGELNHGGKWYEGIKQFILLMNQGSTLAINLRDGTSENPVSRMAGSAPDGIVYAQFEKNQLTISNSKGQKMGTFDVSQLGQFPNGVFPKSMAEQIQLIAAPGSKIMAESITIESPPDGKWNDPDKATPVPADTPTTAPVAPTKPAPTKGPDTGPTPPPPTKAPPPPTRVVPPPTPTEAAPAPVERSVINGNGFSIESIGKYVVAVSPGGFKDQNGVYCPGGGNVCENPIGYNSGMADLNWNFVQQTFAKYINLPTGGKGGHLTIHIGDNPSRFNTQLQEYPYFYKLVTLNSNNLDLYLAFKNGVPESTGIWAILTTMDGTFNYFLSGSQAQMVNGDRSGPIPQDVSWLGRPTKFVIVRR